MTDAASQPAASLLPESWSVKEVVADFKADMVKHLDQQDEMLREIDRKVDSKADKADLVDMGAKFERLHDDHEGRIVSLESHRTEEIASKRFRTKVWGVAASIGAIAAVIIAGLLDSHH